MKEIYAALAKAQAEFLAIEKNREVVIRPKDKTPYQFKYADLDEILNKTRPALNKHGLAVIQLITETDKGFQLKCVLTHASGEEITSSMPIATATPDPKNLGAMITYLRRYLVTAILGVASDDDLDEDGQEADLGERPAQSQKPAVQEPQRRQQPAQQQQAPASNAPANDAPATAGEKAYIGNKLKTKNMALDTACAAAKIDAIADIETLTKAQFGALKSVLL